MYSIRGTPPLTGATPASRRNPAPPRADPSPRARLLSPSGSAASRAGPAPCPARVYRAESGSALCVPVQVCVASALILRTHFALQPGLLHYADEDVFQREAPRLGRNHVDARGRQFVAISLLGSRRIVVSNDVQPVAEQRYAPALGLVLQQVERALRLVGNEFHQFPLLLRL